MIKRLEERVVEMNMKAQLVGIFTLALVLINCSGSDSSDDDDEVIDIAIATETQMTANRASSQYQALARSEVFEVSSAVSDTSNGVSLIDAKQARLNQASRTSNILLDTDKGGEGDVDAFCLEVLDDEPEGGIGLGNIADPLDNTQELELEVNVMLWLPRTMLDVFRCLAVKSTDLANATGTIDLVAIIAAEDALADGDEDDADESDDEDDFQVNVATISYSTSGTVTTAVSTFNVGSSDGEQFELSATSTWDSENENSTGDVSLRHVMVDEDDPGNRTIRTQSSVYSDTDDLFEAVIDRTMADDNGTQDEGNQIAYSYSSDGMTNLRFDAYFGSGGSLVAGTSATVEADGSGCTTRYAGLRAENQAVLLAGADEDCWNANGEWIEE